MKASPIVAAVRLLSALFLVLVLSLSTFTNAKNFTYVAGHGRNCSQNPCAFPFHCKDQICHYEECGTGGCKIGTYCNMNNICAAVPCTANHSCPEYFKCKPSDGEIQACVPCATCEFCGNQGCACRRDSHCKGWKTCDGSFCSGDKPPPPISPSPAASLVPFAISPTEDVDSSKIPMIVGISIGVFLAVLILALVLCVFCKK